MLNKKRILWASFFGTIIFAVLKYFDSHFWPQECALSNPPILECGREFIYYLAMIFIPIFIGSIITLKTKEEVFLLWKKFTFIYVCIYLLIVAMAPWIGGNYFSVEKEVASQIFSLLYLFISLILITYKSIKLRGK
jgi:hypothetical protein